MKKVLFAGGGTGGHVYMGIAIASELQRTRPETGVCFAGGERGIENRIVPESGYRLETIRIGGLKNVGGIRTILTLFQLPPALLKSIRIVRRFSPSIIVSVGGYSAGPISLAGRLLRIPVMLIEPNAFPGFTNRMLSRISQGAALAWEECGGYFRGRVRITGIPVRPEFHQVGEAEIGEGAPLNLLVFGGSQGSRPINRLMVAALPYLDPGRLAILHQTGPHDLEEVRAGYARAGWKNAEITGYLNDMPDRFKWCGLILSRAGASTVAEVAAAGRASVLIPFPQAADNHQEKNALAMSRREASLCLPQEGLTGEMLGGELNRLAGDPVLLKRMGGKARELARPDSSLEIIAFMEELLGTGFPGAAAGGGTGKSEITEKGTDSGRG